MVGSAAFIVGGVLVGAAAVASATGPAITLALVPPTGMSNTAPFSAPLVEGTGWVPGSQPWVIECSVGTGEPTMPVTVQLTNKTTTSLTLPIGCSVPKRVATKVTSNGDLPVTSFLVVAGTVGPPGPGSAGTAAPNYPCPPYADQAGTNSCEIEVLDQNGNSASQPITFATNSTPNTTTTTPPTSTTTAPCNPVNGTITAPITGVTKGTGTATADQSGGAAPTSNPQAVTCLLGGDTVSVAASGLSVGNNGDASILECNSDPNQPTVTFLTAKIPVSCTNVTKYLITMTSNSVPATTFTIVQGITGPPTTGVDSAGNQATADALNYPCPPTAAQIAIGDQCVIAVGTAYPTGKPNDNADQLPIPIDWNTAGGGTISNNSAAATAAAAAAAAAKAAAAKKTATKASSASLAVTGAGPGLWWLGTLGVLLMLFGVLALAMVDGPRRFLRFAVIHSRRTRDKDIG
jgi:hypothetical protein